jgi:hypothetical protein
MIKEKLKILMEVGKEMGFKNDPSDPTGKKWMKNHRKEVENLKKALKQALV